MWDGFTSSIMEIENSFSRNRCRYLKSSTTGLDIDFYIPSEQTAIQVCLQVNDQSAGREVGNLLKAAAIMPDLCRLIIVISEGSPSRHPDHAEIELIPIDVFLLKGLK